MKTNVLTIFEFLSVQKLKYNFLQIVFLIALTFISFNNIYSQTIPGTNSSATTCGDCTPDDWYDFFGTPDISNSTKAGGHGYIGGQATWANLGAAFTLPPPPIGGTTWITMKDLGGNGTEESVTTTLGDIELGKIYRLTLYTMTAVTLEDGGAGLNGANNDEYYGGSYKDKFDYQMGKNVGTLYDRQVVSGVTQNKWGITYFYFIGDPDNIVDGKGTMVLNVFPGEYSAYDGGGSNLTVEILHLAVELNAVEELDSDGDGVADSDDVDDDNDGILDDDELLDLVDGVTIYDPLGDEDGDKLPNYLDVRDDDGTGDFSETDYNDINGDGIPDVFDFDNDGIPNHLDLDSDNDGIPDNIEAQATDSYIAPSGAVGAGFTDVDGDGLDDNYDGTVSGGTPGTDITAVNSDSATVSDNPDYLDLDSDEDGKTDTEEANINLTYNFGTNGLDNAFDNGDGYTDVNGNYDNTPFGEFPNTSAVDSPDDVNWRDIATALDKDTDGDGIPDSADIDDDDDGILDTEECGTTAEAAAAAFGIEAHFGLGGTEANAITSNNLYATLNDVDDFLVIDLNNDSDVAANTIIKIESSVTTNIDHTMRIEESVNGTDFFNQKIYTWTTINTDEDKEYRLESVARYIRITLEVEDGGSLRIDHVSIDGFKVICDPDGDGISNELDLDSDGDGIPDNIEAQATADYDPPLGLDNDGDGLDNEYDDTPNGLADGTDSFGISPNNHDTIDTPDYLDTDSDNDGTLDRIEANLSLTGNNGNNGLDANSENSDNYSDANGNFDDSPYGEFPNNNALDVPNDVDWRDSTTVFTDNDNDGVPDSTDLDDDNDGILDTEESSGFDPLGDDDGDSILNYLDISDDDVGGILTTDYTDANGDGFPDIYHADSDGVPNHFDLDSENDGIPDNIEAQTTIDYIAPNGLFDATGVDTAYSGGLTPQDTDSDGDNDYLETDSDNDGILDNTEAGISLSGDFGTNGLDNNYDNGDNYTDVNGSFDNSQTDNFPDNDTDVFGGGDVDYRDSTFSTDNDGDGIKDEVDLDDDNDGILDTDEMGSCVSGPFTAEIDWDTLYPAGGANSDDGDDPNNSPVFTTNAVEVTFSRTSNVNSDSDFLVNDFTEASSSYNLRQNASFGASSRHIFNFSSPIYGLGFTLYDLNIDVTTTAIDEVQIIITKQDGSTYLLQPADYTVDGTVNEYSGSNTFTGLTTGNGNVTIDLIPEYVIKLQIVYNNAGSGQNGDFNNLAIGNLNFCTPLDSDGDGVFDFKDLDADNDGIPDNIEAQTTADYIQPSGSYNIFGIDLAYDTGLTVVNTDGDANPDYLDLDSDGDLTNDIDEGIINESLPANSGGRFTGEVGTNGLLDALEDADTDQGYTDVNGIHVEPKTDGFLNDDSDSDVLIGGDLDYRDALVGIDTDNDGIVNATDIDDDNDGILDTVESAGFDPLGDEDNDGTLNYLDISDDGSGGPGGSSDYTDDNSDGYPDVYHADSDGVPNHLDIDADNDGIPDNVEAQNTRTTGAGTLYIAPTGIVGTNGFDNAYETALDNGVSIFTPVNTDATHPTESDLIPDYLDTDSDGDLIPDIQENGDSDNAISGTDTDGDGLDDNFEGVDNNDGYDVNDEIDIPQADLPDEDSDVATQDVDYRDTTTGTITAGSAGNILWLRADRDVTDNAGVGQEVTSWIDQTNAFNATSPSGTAPDKMDVGLNFNPVLDFDDANSEDLNIIGGILGSGSTYDNLWTYVVTNPNTHKNSFIFVEAVSGSSLNFHVKISNDAPNDPLVWRQRFGASGTIFQVDNPPNFLNNYSLYTFGTSTSTSTPTGFEQANHQLGGVINTTSGNTIVTITGDGNNMGIGSNAGGSNRYWDGQIAEIMVFNETPTAAKQQQIESYLAIKYGFTLSAVSYSGDIVEGDYVLADQTTKVWDYTANSAYHNDVAGIGRDDAMDFAQYQSKSVGVSSDAIITIGLTAIADSNVNNVNFATGFDSNKDFLMWGNDDGSLLNADVTETELICAPEKTLERKWKIVENGSVGSVEITATKSDLDLALNTDFTIKVLKVADDAAFTTNVKYAPLKEDGTVYTTEFDFNGTKYFTFSEINGIFWNGGATLEADRWLGGYNSGKPTTNPADLDKVMVIDAQGTDNHPTLTEDAIVECVWIKSGSKLMVADNKYLEFDEDFILDGEIRLIDNGQLIQTHTGASNVQGNGKLYRDQAAKVPSIYRYHYWSSPVRELNLDSYRVGEVMKDGNVPTAVDSPIIDIDWVSGYDGDTGTAATGPTYDDGTPIKIAPYWIYTYLNGTVQSDWAQKFETGVIERGQGYTMKSTGETLQNFTFVGTPNDGSITFNFIADKNAESLLGNPYPSALDAVDFIGTNLSAIDGTLYFWEHTGEDDSIATATEGHNLRGYQGGYSQRNISMGIAANSIPAEDSYTFDFEDATDNASNITQTVEGTTITYSTTNSKQNLNTSEDEAANTTGNYLDSDDDIDASFTSTFTFDKDINVQSIYIAKKGAGTLNLTFSTPDGTSNDNVLKTLTDTDGVKVNLFWSEIASFTITGDVPLNLIIDDIIFTEGGNITVGQGDYHAPNRYIAVGQGFFVASSATGGTVRFENSMRNFETDEYDGNDGDGTGTYFYKGNNIKTNEKDQYDLLPILKLGFNHLGSNNIDLHRQIGISFRNTNSFKYDNGYDSEVYDIGSTDIYWHFPKYSDKKLIIAGVKEISDRLEVPLTIKIGRSKPISIEIDAIKNIDRDIFIEDKLLNMFYPLSKETPIILDLEKGTYSDRFYLTFNNKGNSTLNTEENILNTKLAVFMNNKDNEITIQNLNNLIINKLELFNILGKRINVWNDLKNESQYKFKVQELSSSIYVIKISTEKGVLTKKIIID